MLLQKVFLILPLPLFLNEVIKIFSQILSLCRFPLTGFFLHGWFFEVYRQHPSTSFLALSLNEVFCFNEFLSPPASLYIGLHGRIFRF